MMVLYGSEWGVSDPAKRECYATSDINRPGIGPESVRIMLAGGSQARSTEHFDLVCDRYNFWKGLRFGAAPEAASVPFVQADPCERAREAWYPLDNSEGESLRVLMGVLERMTYSELLAHQRDETDGVDYTHDAAACEADIAADRLCYVLMLMQVGNVPAGMVIGTAESIAQMWVDCGQAKRITDDEAEVWAKRDRHKRGGWMDDPAWVKFRENFKRILRAERLAA